MVPSSDSGYRVGFGYEGPGYMVGDFQYRVYGCGACLGEKGTQPSEYNGTHILEEI